MNPPFHAQSRADRPDLGRRFIDAAAQALRAGGRLVLVANRHLPYEAVLAERFAQVRVLADAGGFKVLEGRARMKLVKHIANLGYGSRKEVQWMFREGRITDARRRSAVCRRRGRHTTPSASTANRSIRRPACC